MKNSFPKDNLLWQYKKAHYPMTWADIAKKAEVSVQNLLKIARKTPDELAHVRFSTFIKLNDKLGIEFTYKNYKVIKINKEK